MPPVQVAVRAVGLNFRDVLNVLGMYPGDPGAPGADCAGVVVQVGQAVHHLQQGGRSCSLLALPLQPLQCSSTKGGIDIQGMVPSAGDAVFGLAPGCLGHSVCVDARAVTPKPGSVAFEAAATTPTVYTTVFTAFSAGQGMGPSTRILVHAGTGGVGLAALSVARALGCQAVATAGSAAKRGCLRGLHVLGAADSRSTSFTEPLLTTHGAADVVLNSLTSPGDLLCNFTKS